MKTLMLYATGAALGLLYLLLFQQNQLVGADVLQFLWVVAGIVLAVALARSLEYLIVDVYFTRIRPDVPSELFRVIVQIVVYAGVALAVARYGFGANITNLLATSAVLSVVLGFALQPTLGNLFSGVALELERPVRIGDFVRTADMEGRVIAMNWRSVTLETPHSCRVVLPNAVFTNGPVEIHPFDVPTSYQASFTVPGWVPPSKVMRICQRVMCQPIQDLEQEPAPYTKLIGVVEYGSRLKFAACFFTCNQMRHHEVASDILERLWYALQREDIELTASEPTGLNGADDGGGQGLALRLRKVLAEVPMFASLEAAAIDELAHDCKRIYFTRHEQVLFSGESARTMYVIASGRLRVPRRVLGTACCAEGEQGGTQIPGDWPPHLLERITKELTYQIGPVAKVLVKDTASATRDPHALFQSLGALIPDEMARSRFLATAPLEPSEELLPGAVISDWAVCTGESPTSWEAYATEQTELVVLTAERLRTVLAAYPGSVDILAKGLALNYPDISEAEILERTRVFHNIS